MGVMLSEELMNKAYAMMQADWQTLQHSRIIAVYIVLLYLVPDGVARVPVLAATDLELGRVDSNPDTTSGPLTD